jgi:hypothetical protein
MVEGVRLGADFAIGFNPGWVITVRKVVIIRTVSKARPDFTLDRDISIIC